MKSILLKIYFSLKLYYIWQPIKLLNPAYKCAQMLNRRGIGPTLSLTFDIIKCSILYGADADNYNNFKFYRLNHRGRKEYLTSRFSSWIVRKYEREVEILFSNKTLFNQSFNNYIHREWIPVSSNNWDQFCQFVVQNGEVIIKPNGLFHGKGVEIVTSSSLNEKCDFEGIAEQRLRNHDAISRLNPTSVNTIRVVTLLDKNDKARILCAILRIGSNHGILDNAKAGGISCLIDINTGRIATNGQDFNGNEYFTHPITGVYFNGYEIPRWKEVIKLAIKLASIDMRARLVGWDIVITPEYIELLEGNIPPGENIMQMFLGKGLKKDILSQLI